MSDEFISEADLGRLLGVSEHMLVLWLVLVGLRTRDRMPSARAVGEGLVRDRENTPGRHFWLWHKGKTLKALKDAVER